MSDNAILEAAALEIEKMLDYYFGKTTRPSEIPYGIARAVLATVTPLIEEAYARSRATIHVAAIRNAALEEAAVVAEDVDRDVAAQNSTWSVGYFAQHIRGTAAAIRALKAK